MTTQDTTKLSPTQILQEAKRLKETNPDWVTYFRAVLGVDGLVERNVPKEELDEFLRSSIAAEIRDMMAELRVKISIYESGRVITVRLPSGLHESLKAEAHRHMTSLNQLCVSKLLQPLSASQKPRSK